MTLMEKLKKHWIISTGAAIMGIVLYVAAAYGDIKTVATDIASLFQPPNASLSIQTMGDLHPGDRFTLSYTAPAEGYLSVWVQDAASGKIDKLLPTNGMGALHLNATNNTGDLGLRVKPGSKGTDVYEVLWTPESKPDHLPYSQYDTLAAFEAAIQILINNTKGVQRKSFKVPVYP